MFLVLYILRPIFEICNERNLDTEGKEQLLSFYFLSGF